MIIFYLIYIDLSYYLLSFFYLLIYLLSFQRTNICHLFHCSSLISALITLIYFYLLIWGLACYCFLRPSYEWLYCSFETVLFSVVFRAIHFCFGTAFIASYRFWYVMSSFSFNSSIFKKISFLRKSLAYSAFKSAWINMFICFLISLLLIYSVVARYDTGKYFIFSVFVDPYFVS